MQISTYNPFKCTCTWGEILQPPQSGGVHWISTSSDLASTFITHTTGVLRGGYFVMLISEIHVYRNTNIDDLCFLRCTNKSLAFGGSEISED